MRRAPSCTPVRPWTPEGRASAIRYFHETAIACRKAGEFGSAAFWDECATQVENDFAGWFGQETFEPHALAYTCTVTLA